MANCADPEDAADLADGIETRQGVKGDQGSRNLLQSLGDSKYLNAADGYAKACGVQCVLTGVRGPPVVLHGLFSSSLCSEVYTSA